MKDFKYIWLLLLLILNSFGACSDDDPLMPGERPSSGTDPAPEEQVLHDGFNFDPAIPKADEPLTITFKAPEEVTSMVTLTTCTYTPEQEQTGQVHLHGEIIRINTD